MRFFNHQSNILFDKNILCKAIGWYNGYIRLRSLASSYLSYKARKTATDSYHIGLIFKAECFRFF